MQRILLPIYLFISSFSFAQESLKEGKSIEKKLSKDEKHSYSIEIKTGECVSLIIMQKGVDIAVDVVTPSGQKMRTFDSPNGNEGEEQIFIEATQAGQYFISVYPLIEEWTDVQRIAWKDRNPGKSFDSLLVALKEANQGNYEVMNLKILSPAQCQKKLSDEKIALQKEIEESRANAAKTIKWIGENAHPIKSVRVGSGLEDLQWLKPVLKGVKYVGLGEATHGTREFFQMKHRMLEFLVKEMGYTVFAMEASYQGCENINNYIMYGKGDAHTALTSQGFWTWDTEEVIDMIEWIRKYNQTVPKDKKVRFFGFDIQTFAKSGAIDTLHNYLLKVDTALAKSKNKIFPTFYKQDIEKVFYGVVAQYISGNPKFATTDTLKAELSDMLMSIVLKRGDYLNKSNEEEYRHILYIITNMLQFIDAYDPNHRLLNLRDYYMASNFQSFVQQNPKAKIVIWAHNGHISKNTFSKPFGGLLKLAYGNAYFPIGFSFNKGGFQAIEIDNGKPNGLKEFTVPAAKDSTLDWYLAQAGKEMFIINFRRRNPIYIDNFLNSVLRTRSFGAIAKKNDFSEFYAYAKLSNDFDAVIFINTTTRSRPTPTGMR